MRGLVRSSSADLSPIALALAIALEACGGVDAPPKTPAQNGPTTDPMGAPEAKAGSPAPADVAGLKRAFLTEGSTVEVTPDSKGRVAELRYTEVSRAGMFINGSSEAHVHAFARAHGPKLGYGALGEPGDDVRLGEATIRAPQTLVVPYPKAEGCPGLAVILRYTVGTDKTGLVGMPQSFELLCPSEPSSLKRLREIRDQPRASIESERVIDEALKSDRLAKWLIAQNYGRPLSFERQPSKVRVLLHELGGTETRAPLVVARDFAEKVAAVEGLPKLDKVELQHQLVGRDGKPSKEITGVILRPSSLAPDAECLKASVTVDLRTSAEPQPPSIETVSVECEREPKGPRPPPDANRALPKSFAKSAEYLAHCETTGPRWGATIEGIVVDRRGDVYSYFEDPPTQAAPNRTAQVSALARQFRHNKRFYGTLPAADVERLVELLPKLAHEKMVTTKDRRDQAHGGNCFYYQAGATKEALVPIPIDSYSSRDELHREGEATKAAEAIFGRAETLRSRGQ